MKKGWIIGGVAVVALCLVVGKKLMTPKQFAQGVSDPVVVAENPEIRDIELTSGLVGSVEPEDVVYVYPKAGGDVTAVNVQAGDTVKAGQLLCVIDTKQVESAKSSLDSAQLALRQAQEDSRYSMRAVESPSRHISSIRIRCSRPRFSTTTRRRTTTTRFLTVR